MRILLFLFSLLILFPAHAQEISAEEFQEKLNETYRSPEVSPLKEKDRKHFESLRFFPISEDFQFEAHFIRVEGTDPFEMKTSTDRKPVYQKYAELKFEYEGQVHVLNAYQNMELSDREGYEDYLFVPFTDLSNGEDSYGGGRYIDLRIPDGEQILLDFNQSYNPLCAYNHKYSCPVPPAENHLKFRVEAGVQYKSGSYDE